MSVMGERLLTGNSISCMAAIHVNMPALKAIADTAAAFATSLSPLPRRSRSSTYAGTRVVLEEDGGTFSVAAMTLVSG